LLLSAYRRNEDGPASRRRRSLAPDHRLGAAYRRDRSEPAASLAAPSGSSRDTNPWKVSATSVRANRRASRGRFDERSTHAIGHRPPPSQPGSRSIWRRRMLSNASSLIAERRRPFRRPRPSQPHPRSQRLHRHSTIAQRRNALARVASRSGVQELRQTFSSSSMLRSDDLPAARKCPDRIASCAHAPSRHARGAALPGRRVADGLLVGVEQLGSLRDRQELIDDLVGKEGITASARASIGTNFGLSCRVGGDSSVRERDLDAGAAEVDHRDERVGGVESVCAV
jgi:hypothetical protein